MDDNFLNIVTLIFTLAAMSAVSLHALVLREAVLNQVAVRAGMPDGLGESVAIQNVRTETVRLVKGIIVLFFGIGILVHAPALSWSLVVIPGLGIWASVKDLASRERQAKLAAKVLAEHCAEAAQFPSAPGE